VNRKPSACKKLRHPVKPHQFLLRQNRLQALRAGLRTFDDDCLAAWVEAKLFGISFKALIKGARLFT
jgi:hypothetical protein